MFSRVCLLAVAVFAAAESAAASVDSVTVSTSTWKRTVAEAVFRPGQVALRLSFEKQLAERPALKTDDGFEYREPGPTLDVTVTYREQTAPAIAEAVGGLEGAFDGSTWHGAAGVRAQSGKAVYEAGGSVSREEAASFLKAATAGDPILYRMRRQSPAAVRVTTRGASRALFESREATDFFRLRRPDRMPDLECAVTPGAPFLLTFEMRAEELVFRKQALHVTPIAARAGVRVWMRAGAIALYADTTDAGAAEFDLGPEAAPGEWRYQAGSDNPVAADAVMPVTGRVLVRPDKISTVTGPFEAPSSALPQAVASALAAAYERPGAAAPSPAVTVLLWAQASDRKAGPSWKASPFWTESARGGKTGPVIDTAGWLDGVRSSVESEWIAGKAREALREGASSWTPGDAQATLALLREAELRGGPATGQPERSENSRAGVSPVLAREAGQPARAAADRFFTAVLSASEPVGRSGATTSSDAAAGHAFAALTLYKASEMFRDPGFRRMAHDQVAHLLSDHVRLPAGTIHGGKVGGADVSLRTAGVVCQAIQKAWRFASKPAQKAALAAIRKRLLTSWDAKTGTFGRSSKGGGVDPLAAFWALSAFTEGFYPYWDPPSDDWLR